MGENENKTDLRAQLEAALADQPEAPVEAPAEAPVEAPAEVPQEATQEAPQTAPQEAPAAPPQPNPMQDSGMTRGQADMYNALFERSAQALRAVQEENAKLRAQIEQQSQANEEKVEAAVAEPPVLDMSQWGYMTDAQRTDAQSKYQNDVMAYFKNAMMSELAPLKEAYAKQRADAARQEAIAALSTDARFEGFSDALPQIQNVLDKTPELKDTDPRRAYQIAYAINRGFAPKPQRSAAEIAEEAMKNPEVMRIIETKRATDTAAKNADVPVVSAASGMSSAAAVPTNRPKTIEEAHKMWEGFNL